jgi:hypothetical protein
MAPSTGNRASRHQARTRAETPYRWYVSCGMPLYAKLAGVRYDRIFRERDAIVEAYTEGQPLARELYGPDVNYGGPGWAGISYGHVNCLGSELVFPSHYEVAHTPIHGSLQEGIAALEKAADRELDDWANGGLMPFYLELWEQLKAAFPNQNIPFGGFGAEGPITTAWELRGHGFFMDVYDDPVLCKEYLGLVTDSVASYLAFIRTLNGQPAYTDQRLGLYDDVASMIHPDLWREMVYPFHEQFFVRQTSGQRHAHIENLVPDHLPFLDQLRLDSFDPSVSTKLTPRDLRDRCSVPFLWRLNSMQVRDLTHGQIRRFVFEAVADGASGVFCAVAAIMADAENAAKVHTFIDAAKQVGALLGEGCPRSRLLEREKLENRIRGRDG